MARNSSQSPRALRDSTNTETYAKGDVQLGMTNPRKEVNQFEPTETPDPLYDIDGFEPNAKQGA
jgi:hypothetical protein